jgi:hypothetical protein
MIKIFFLILISLSPEKVPDIVLEASKIYFTEKENIKNYKSKQNLISTVNSAQGKIIEKRFQTGIYLSNGEYTYITHELELNGIKQILNKDIIEKSYKQDFDWLTKDGLDSHTFIENDSDSNYRKFLVNPKILRPNFYRGQIWIDLKTKRIFRIMKEPIIKKKGIEKFFLELRFEKKFQYQMPSSTKLIANYNYGQGLQKVEIDIDFLEYQFNLKN